MRRLLLALDLTVVRFGRQDSFSAVVTCVLKSCLR